MSEAALTYQISIYEKTTLGQQEIQTRALGLPLLMRRLLVLVDGQRRGEELAQFVTGQDAGSLLGQLVEKGCVAVKAELPPVNISSTKVPPAQAAAGPVATEEAMAGLPDVSTRSPKDIEMARNFMTNTVNTIFGHHNRISLIEAVFACKTAEDLRKVYPSWVQTMQGSMIGNKRLPELSKKLFEVL